MYSPSPKEDFSSSCLGTAAQRRSQHEMFKEVSQQKSPSKVLFAREAAQELLHTDLSYSGQVATTVRDYGRGLLSVPSSGNHTVDLSGVLDEAGRETILDPPTLHDVGDPGVL